MTGLGFWALPERRSSAAKTGSRAIWAPSSVAQRQIVSSSTTKEWESATTHCAGYIRVIAGKQVGKGVCKWIQATGDTATGEWEYPPAGEPSWRWLAGTGKLKGIAGGGTFKAITSAKPAEPGTSQGCRRDSGNYTLL